MDNIKDSLQNKGDNLSLEAIKKIDELERSNFLYIIAIQEIKKHLLNESLRTNDLIEICDEVLTKSKSK